MKKIINLFHILGAMMFQYYIKIIPTLYESETSRVFTNQFSITRHEKVVSVMSGENGMPGNIRI
jgi:endoplasmic reticulum-Golgi intermediate compartment protein 3